MHLRHSAALPFPVRLDRASVADTDVITAAHSDAPWAPFALHGRPFSVTDSDSPSSSSSSPVRMAFIADVDLRPHGAGRPLLRMVAEQKVDATLLTGDMDYLQLGQDRPERAGQRRSYPTLGLAELDRTLGESHPIFPVMGNHEAEAEVVFHPQPSYPNEPTYAAIWQSRMERLRLNDSCTGWIGGDSACSLPSHRVLIVSSNVAVADEPHRLVQRRIEHEEFVASALDRYGSQSRWRLCQWHVPAYLLNTGNLPRSPQDDPGLKFLRAPILSAGLNGQPDETSVHGAPYYYTATSSRAELLVLSEGSSFAFVNGLGGLDIRSTHRGKDRASHWAKLKNALPEQWRGPSPRDSTALLCTFGALAPSSVLKGTPRTREGFIQAYDIPSEIANRIDDFEAQSGWCTLTTADGHVEDEFILLSIVSVEKKKSQPSPAAVVELVAAVASDEQSVQPIVRNEIRDQSKATIH